MERSHSTKPTEMGDDSETPIGRATPLPLKSSVDYWVITPENASFLKLSSYARLREVGHTQNQTFSIVLTSSLRKTDSGYRDI